MSVSFKMKGLRDIERALAQLPAGTAKGVTRRAMKKELAPIARMANSLWPGSEDDVVRVTSKIAGSQPQPEKGKHLVHMGVGAAGSRTAHLIEWGTGPRHWRGGKFTGQVSPQPFMAPAWDAHRGGLAESLGARLWEEIAKTMARRAKKGK